MKEILVLLASTLDEQDIIKLIKSSIAEWEADNSPEKLKQIRVMCTLFATKEVTNKKDPDVFLRELEEIKQIKDRLNTQKA